MTEKNKYINYSIALLKQIDYFAGPVLLKTAKFVMEIGINKHRGRYRGNFDSNKRYSLGRCDISRILVIRPGGIGDAVLLVPSLKILRQVMPCVQIDLVCEPRNKGIFDDCPWVDRVVNYKDPGDMLRIAKIHYDIVFDTEQSHFLSAVFASWFRHSFKIGFSTNKRESVYDVAVEYHQNQYEMESFFMLFKRVIKRWPMHMVLEPPFFSAGPDEQAKVDRLTKGMDRPIACIFPGASIKQRHWPVKRWSDVADNLWEKGFHVILLGGKGEKNINSKITGLTCSPVMNLCCRLTLNETAALFKQTSLLISTDSGILHLGVLSGLSTISLFGPGIAEKWGPVGNNHIILNKNLPCSPCTRFGETPPCPLGGKCMDEIKVTDVVKAVSELSEINAKGYF